jgi:oligosaccharide repeat unit polymerase
MRRLNPHFIIYLGLISLTFLLVFSSSLFINTNFRLSLILISLLFVIISGFFILKKSIEIFDPMVIFSAYYYTVVLSGIFLISTNFKYSDVFKNTSISPQMLSLLNFSLFYLLVGYLFTLLGYFCVYRKKTKIRIILERESQIPDFILNVVITTFLLIGLLNFAYMVFVFAGGKIFLYMKNVVILKYELADSGATTLGYLLAYTAMYLWFFKLLRRQKLSLIFLMFLVITGLMKASTGRITQTLVYLCSFIVIYYYFDIAKNEKVKNIRYVFSFLIFIMLGIGMYLLRIFSALSANKLEANIKDIFTIFSNNFGFFVIGKGNVPNIPIVMKIIERWADDVGFLYGQSLLKPFFTVLPSSIRPETAGYSLGLTIRQTWYSGIQGGELPPTGVGEMYANFGILGPFVGMFLFGAFCAWLYNLMLKTGSYWVLAIYSQILLGFIMIYTKGELSNLSLWYVLPIAFTVVLIKFLTYVSRVHKKIYQRQIG